MEDIALEPGRNEGRFKEVEAAHTHTHCVSIFPQKKREGNRKESIIFEALKKTVRNGKLS